MLDSGAKVYVFGDGIKMEPDVRRAGRDMYRTQTRPTSGRRALACPYHQNRYGSLSAGTSLDFPAFALH